MLRKITYKAIVRAPAPASSRPLDPFRGFIVLEFGDGLPSTHGFRWCDGRCGRFGADKRVAGTLHDVG